MYFSCRPARPGQDLLLDVFELLDVGHFDVVWVVCQEVDGVGHHVLRQQRQQLVCGEYGLITTEPLKANAQSGCPSETARLPHR